VVGSQKEDIMNELKTLRKLLTIMISEPLNQNSTLTCRELWDIYAFCSNLDIEIREILRMPSPNSQQMNLLQITESLLAAWNELDKHPFCPFKPQPVINNVIEDLMILTGSESVENVHRQRQAV